MPSPHAPQAGRLDNTIVVFTSDNGMPFRRAKANLYDGARTCRWRFRFPGKARSGQQRNDFVVLTDLRPRCRSRRPDASPSMTGRTLCPCSRRASAEPGSGIVERERHRAGTSRRPVVSRARGPDRGVPLHPKLPPDRWPGRDPDKYFAVGPFGDIDGGPSKSLCCSKPQRSRDRCGLRARDLERPQEELYDLRKDPIKCRTWQAGGNIRRTDSLNAMLEQ